MKKNIGNTDKIIRIILSVALAVLFFTRTVEAAFGMVLLVLGGFFLATALIDFCPIYRALGLNSTSAKNK